MWAVFTYRCFEMSNYKLIVEYEGTNYHGFQIQKGGIITIQGCLEEAIAQIAKKQVKIIGGGRTDAGVHALSQVVNFRSNLTVPVEKLSTALNSLLPKDIRVKTASLVHDDFHSRYDAATKTYLYLIEYGLVESVFKRNYCWWLKKLPVWDNMLTAGKYLEGTQDFAAFTASGSSVKSTVRTISSFDLEVLGNAAKLRFTADGFLYYMVRNMVGTLVEIGLGRRDVDSIKRILKSKDRTQAGVTAPARGLFLEKIQY